MYPDRNQLLLLSRGRVIPPASHPRPRPIPPGRGPGPLARLIRAVRSRPRRHAELGVQTYLELEFRVDDER